MKARIEKVVSQLPATLEKNTVYYVRVGNGFEIYVTNNSGVIVAYPSNYLTSNNLVNYVTTNTAQGINGHKTFLNGLSIVGSSVNTNTTKLILKNNAVDETWAMSIGLNDWTENHLYFGLFNQASGNFGNGMVLSNDYNLSVTGNTRSEGFIKSGYNDSYLLLAGGGAKLISDFALGSQLNNYVAKTGDTMSGMLNFSDDLGGISGQMGGNDYWRIWGRSTGSDLGYLEIATADGGIEPIHFSQYSYNPTTGEPFGQLIRRATILDEAGNTSFPQNVNADAFIKKGGDDTSFLLDGGGIKDINSLVQVGGSGNANPIKLGWTGYQIRMQVDNSFVGYIATTDDLTNYATTAQLDGKVNATNSTYGLEWDGTQTYLRRNVGLDGFLFHSGNFNPSNYATNISLEDYYKKMQSVYAINGQDAQTITSFDELNGRTQMGSISAEGHWWHTINIQHRNGLTDGSVYSGQIRFGMTGGLETMQFRQNYSGNWTAWKTIYSSGNLNLDEYAKKIGVIKIDTAGGIANGSDSRVNTAFFEYNWANTGRAGSVINFSGLGGNYSTEIFGSYNYGGNNLGFRTKDGDNGQWNLHHWIWHTGNFNPADYATQAWVGQQGYLTATSLNGYATQAWVQSLAYLTLSSLNGYATENWSYQIFVTQLQFTSTLAGYATLDGDQTFHGVNTFVKNPIIPDAIEPNNPVSLAQLNEILTQTVVNVNHNATGSGNTFFLNTYPNLEVFNIAINSGFDFEIKEFDVGMLVDIRNSTDLSCGVTFNGGGSNIGIPEKRHVQFHMDNDGNIGMTDMGSFAYI